jgi:hypothetical protein
MKTSNYSAIPRARSSRPPFLASGQKASTPARLILCCVLTALTALSANAQIQQAWVARYNNGITNGTNQAVKMALDSVGNIYVTGFSQNANSNLGYVTIKYAPSGSPLWPSRYDSTNNPSATPAALALDGSNDVVVTGSALTVKYDPNGNQLWTAPYPGSALAVDSNANVYVAGFSQNFGTVKLSPQGSNVWMTTYVESYGPTVSQAVLVDSANNIYVSGLDSYYSFVEHGVTYGPYVTLTTIKYDSNGNQIWKTSGAPAPQSGNMQLEGAAFDSGSNLYVLGNFTPDYGYTTFECSTNGDLVWIANNPTANGASQAHGLAVDGLGNVFVTGANEHYPPVSRYGTYRIISNGAYVWTNLYPTDGVNTGAATSIAVDSANNCYVTGYSTGTNTGNDIVTIKYGPNGNQVWLQRYHGPGNGNDAGNAIAVDNKGNVYVTGYETTAAGGTEIVTIKYSPVTLQRRSDGTVLLQAQGTNGESFDFQGSTDLMNWLDLGSVLADSNGLAQFQDTNASNYNWRFYITSPQ